MREALYRNGLAAWSLREHSPSARRSAREDCPACHWALQRSYQSTSSLTSSARSASRISSALVGSASDGAACFRRYRSDLVPGFRPGSQLRIFF